MTSNQKVRELGRLRYVEPTNFFNRQEGGLSDSINFPYEDYCMAVDLTIKQSNRYSCGWWESSNDFSEITYSSKNGSISFLGGTDIGSGEGYLTTNYTDISMVDPETNTGECLGISSINIQYDSWWYPQVTIKFVDVRGATVMQPAEKGYYNNREMGVASSIYKSLFSFPYPMFILKVKGFYGKGVTYHLALHNTVYEFDANTGDFNITASFIGYKFGVYTDIPISFISCSPFMEGGKEYWESKVADGTFTFRDANGNQAEPMCTIPELRLKLAKAANNQDAISAAAEEQEVLDVGNAQMQILFGLRDDFPFRDWKNANGFIFPNTKYCFKLFKDGFELANFYKEVTDYVTKVKLYDERYGTNLLDFMSVLNTKEGKLEEYIANSPYLMRFIPNNEYNTRDNYVEKIDTDYVFSNPKNFFGVYENDDEKHSIIDLNISSIFLKTQISNAVYNDIIRNSKDSNLITYWIEEERNGLNHFYVLAYKLTDAFNANEFNNYVNYRNEEVQNKAAEKRNEYREKSAIALEKAVGFRPSIRNIYELIFAHIDTFTHTFYASTKKIKDQLEGDKTKRAKSRFYIEDGYTDTENVKIKQSNGLVVENSNARSKYLPPYAAYYTPNRSGVAKGKVLTWLEEIPNGETLEEVNFVRNLTAGAESYFKRYQEIEKIIEEMNSTEDTKIDVSHDDTDTPLFDVTHFIPVTVFDFAFKGKYENPYLGLKNKLDKSVEIVEAEILTILALRAAQYLTFTNIDEADEGNSKAFGRIEAINLFKAVGDDFSNGFLGFLRKYAIVMHDNNTKEKNEDDEKRTTALNNLLNDFIKELTDETYDGVLSKQLQKDAPNLNKTLFKSEGDGKLVYNYSKGLKSTDKIVTEYGGVKTVPYIIYPYHISSIAEMQKCYSEGDKILSNQQFLTDRLYYKLYSKGEDAPTSFVVYNSRNYIDNIYNAFENEISLAISYAATGATTLYGNRGPSDYNDLQESATTLSKYKDNFVTTALTENQYYSALLVGKDDIKKITELPDLIFNGKVEEQDKYYIKYTTFDYTFDSEKPTSLFSNSLYHDQGENYKAKAYLFLMSAPLIAGPKGMLVNGYNGKSLKALLLREGAIYWSIDNYGKGEGVKWPEKVFKYDSKNQPVSDTEKEIKDSLFTKINGGIPFPLHNDKAKWNNWVDNPKMENFTYFKADDIRYYNSLPKKTSPSRIKVLKKYFEDWAEGAFKENEKRLTNIKYYSRSFSDIGEKVISNYEHKKYPYWYKFCHAEVKINKNETVYDIDVKDKSKVLTEERSYDNGLDVTFLLNTETEEARELRELQKFLRDLFLSVSTTIEVFYSFKELGEPTVKQLYDTYPKNSGDIFLKHTRIKATETKLKNVLEGFIGQLYITYYKPISDYSENRTKFYEEVATSIKLNPFKNTDLKLSTYMTLKSLYDKWFCFPVYGPEKTWALTRKRGSKSEFDNFIYVDSLYNEIGDKLLVNLTKVSDWLSTMIPSSNVNTTEGIMQYTGKSVIEFLTEVAQSCGGNLFAIPQRFALTDSESVRDMFTPMPLYSDWDDDSTGYVFMYTYQPSQHLGDNTTSNVDMNGWSPDGDGLDLSDDEIVGSVLSDDENSYNIPAFGVTYAKQNQSIFKNIQMTTANMAVTEASISATFNVASKMSESPRETVVFGQDLYRVYSNYSYNCSVETMGNMQIMPMMYFQLNNVPFWRGAYQIIKVSHNITAGNMTTSFEGVRINRHAIPLADGALIVECVPPSEGGSSGGSYNGEYGGGNVSADGFKWLRDVDISTIIDTSQMPASNSYPTSNYWNNKNQLFGDHLGGSSGTSIYWNNFSKDDLGFEPANVTETNPIICLLPSHSPKNKDKGWGGTGNNWSKTAWEDTSYIGTGASGQTGENKWSAEIVGLIYKELKKEGYNVVSPRVICNADGTISFNDDYGEKKKGTPAYELVGRFGSKKVISIMPHWNACGGDSWLGLMRAKGEKTRFDSVKLMECICSAAYEFGKNINKDTAESYGVPVINGKMPVSNDRNFYFVTHYYGDVANDAGCLPNCAAACTENWFCDWSDKNQRIGRDKWLGTDAGKKTVAKIHVDGIKKYINQLKNGGFKSTGNSSKDYETEAKNKGYVDITTQQGCNDILVDIRYATNSNLTKTNLYGNFSKAYVHKSLVLPIQKANVYLKSLGKGYQLKIWDALRPNDAQKIGDKVAPKLFGPPLPSAKASYHIYGLAIDCTIVENGKELNMGTGMDASVFVNGIETWDTTGSRCDDGGIGRLVNRGVAINPTFISAHVMTYFKEEVPDEETRKEIANNRVLLYTALVEKGGFSPIANEWWHFEKGERHEKPLDGKP